MEFCFDGVFLQGHVLDQSCTYYLAQSFICSLSSDKRTIDGFLCRVAYLQRLSLPVQKQGVCSDYNQRAQPLKMVLPVCKG